MRHSTGLIERDFKVAPLTNRLSATSELAHHDTLPQLADRRNIERRSVLIRGLLYHGDRFQTTTIENLSSGGAGLNGAIGITPGDEVTIRLLDGREISGEVIWWLAGHCGVDFYTELKPDDPLFQPKRSRFSQ